MKPKKVKKLKPGMITPSYTFDINTSAFDAFIEGNLASIPGSGGIKEPESFEDEAPLKIEPAATMKPEQIAAASITQSEANEMCGIKPKLYCIKHKDSSAYLTPRIFDSWEDANQEYNRLGGENRHPNYHVAERDAGPPSCEQQARDMLSRMLYDVIDGYALDFKVAPIPKITELSTLISDKVRLEDEVNERAKTERRLTAELKEADVINKGLEEDIKKLDKRNYALEEDQVELIQELERLQKQISAQEKTIKGFQGDTPKATFSVFPDVWGKWNTGHSPFPQPYFPSGVVMISKEEHERAMGGLRTMLIKNRKKIENQRKELARLHANRVKEMKEAETAINALRANYKLKERYETAGLPHESKGMQLMRDHADKLKALSEDFSVHVLHRFYPDSHDSTE
jgi:hypothetical protein